MCSLRLDWASDAWRKSSERDPFRWILRRRDSWSPVEQIEGLVLTGQPMVFRAGSATVLGEFRREKDRLVVELAQIEGGGEGVLVSLGSLVKRYARLHRIETVEWIIHAVTCAKPNLKLRRVLDRRGFPARDVPGSGKRLAFGF